MKANRKPKYSLLSLRSLRCSSLNVAIGNGSVRSHLPALNRVVVVVGIEAAHGGELGARRLDVPRVVGAARLQRCRLTTPTPRRTESRVRLPQDRLLHRSIAPRGTAVGAD